MSDDAELRAAAQQAEEKFHTWNVRVDYRADVYHALWKASFRGTDGYDAGYYGYLWSEAIAGDMSSVFERARGFLDRDAGMRLRGEIYEKSLALMKGKFACFWGAQATSLQFAAACREAGPTRTDVAHVHSAGSLRSPISEHRRGDAVASIPLHVYTS